MLLSKIPVLDKGYVALIDSSCTTRKLREIGKEFYSGNDGEYPISLEEFGTLTLAIKCPLFIQLALSKYNLKMVNINEPTQEAYIPNVGDVRGKSVGDSQIIVDDISRTTDALLINPKAYQADGCDRFISQLITPINTYTLLIANASYNEWCKFTHNDKYPSPIKAYTIAIQQIIDSEWI